MRKEGVKKSKIRSQYTILKLLKEAVAEYAYYLEIWKAEQKAKRVIWQDI